MPKRIKKLPIPDLSQPLSPQLIGLAIKARRTQSNLRIEDAAALCGVAKQTFLRIEQGHGTSHLGNVLQICQSLGITLTIQAWEKQDEVEDGWY